MKRIAAVAILLAILMWTGSAFADTTGIIRGTVMDSSGAAIPGAQVTVVDEATNEKRSLAAEPNGSFEFLLLPVGTYTLRVEHPRFKTYVLKEITLSVNQVASYNVTLQVGAVESQVEVQANPIQVDTATTQIGTVIGTRTIQDLPLNGRNMYQLVALQPGISVPGQGTASTGTSGQSPDPNNPVFAFRQQGSALVFSSSGGRLVANSFMVDGADTNGLAENQAVIRIIPDAVQEFRVLTNTFNAEFGTYSGSVVNIITMSGINQWHGDLFEFFRNDVLNARNFFETQKAPYRLNQFGGTAGGPVLKGKTFVFGSIQETRQRRGVSGFARSVFSDQERAGNFSDRESQFAGKLTNALCFPRDVAGSPCFAAGTPYSTIFPNATIPTSMWDPISQTILTNFLPRANLNGNQLSVSPVEPLNDTQWSLKVDHSLNSAHKLSVLYFFDNSTLQNFGVEQDDIPGFPVETDERDQQLTLNETWIRNPTTLNQFHFTFIRQSKGKNRNPVRVFTPASIGFTGIATGLPANLNSLPVIRISGGPTFEGPSFGSGGGIDKSNVFHFDDDLSKVLGRHTLKFGGGFSRIQYTQEEVFVFDGDFTFGGFGPNTTGDPFADFALGLPDSYSQGSASFEHLRSNTAAIYGQDTWQVRPNLTLNYGLRWEVTTPYYDTQDAIETFRFPSAPGQPLPQSTVFPTSPLGLVFPGDRGVPRGLTATYWRSFAPRIGLAYSPAWFGANKLVIRAAYGIFYNPIEQSVLLQFNGDPPYGGSSFVGASGFATPFLDQSGAPHPDPFPFVPPQRGQLVNFNSFLPIFAFGDFTPKLRSQYVEQYNLMAEYQLNASTVLGAGYVGSQGHRLLASYDANPGSAALCMQLASAKPFGCGAFGEDITYTTASGQTVFGTRPVGPLSNNGTTEAFGNIFFLNSIANSAYNSLQVHLEKRANDLQFLASYTFSKSLDNASGFENLLNPFCFRCDRQLSGFDVRNRFVFSYTYLLPFKRLFNPTGIREKFVDGWEIGGITTFQSGIPVHLTDLSSDASLTGSFDFEPADRPSIVGPVQTMNPRGPGHLFFNPSSFTTEPFGTFGNVPHNLFHGPGINNWDFSVIKRTQFGERLNWEFRAEFFNLFNHTQFLNPNGDVSAGTFGQVQSARDPRFVQFGTKLTF